MVFIKNAYTGRYLDVPYANAYATQNVWECEFTGATAQQWKMLYISDGNYRIVPRCAASTSNGVTTYSVCLDIDAATNTNGSNLQLYTLHTGDNQKFGFTYNNDGSYIISTAYSSHTRALGVTNQSLLNQANVAQYSYDGTAINRWILEPVDRDAYFAGRYLSDMINKKPGAFPYMSSFYYETPNFSSQGLLSSGIHFTGNWELYRKTTNDTSLDYSTITSHWDMPNTVYIPWISITDFRQQFQNNIIWFCKGSQLVNHPEYAMALNLAKADVIHMSYDNLPNPDSAINVSPLYSMSVTGTTTYNGSTTYSVSYRSNIYTNVQSSLLELATANPDRYFVFYKF